MADFWSYFRDVLRLPFLAKEGALQALARGLAQHMDSTAAECVFLRDQFFPTRCEQELVAEHGQGRGILRHAKETEEQYRARVAHAYAWHLLGGKTLGLPAILNFYGYPIEAIESRRQYIPSRWAEFEVRLQNIANPHELNNVLSALEQLIWLINEYKPARSVLARIYNQDFDTRFIIWSRRSHWSRYYWSYDSGIRDKQSGTLVSLGYKHGFTTQPLAISAFPSHSASHALLLRLMRAWVWGYSPWSDTFPPASAFVHGQLGLHGFVRPAQPWHFRRFAVAREQLVWSGASPQPKAGHWGDVNCRWSKGFFRLVDAPPRWGVFRWGDACGLRCEVTLERRIAAQRTSASLSQHSALYRSARQARHAACAPVFPENVWRGAWSARSWNPCPPVPHKSTAYIQEN
ncbi:MAG: phage tail protein [Desulfovibrionaceae bacterium]|nr:phage tail protein [Desulfovibrionaceae bacterium]